MRLSQSGTRRVIEKVVTIPHMGQYYYLIASLPMLEFRMKPPFSYAVFLSACSEWVSSTDMGIVRRANTAPCENADDGSSILRGWKGFDIVLRNETARQRARRRGKDPGSYIREGGYADSSVIALAQWAVNQDSPLEAELALDRFRWEKLEELEKGHYFDIDFLIIYALKLQILKRWERIDSEGGMEVLAALT